VPQQPVQQRQPQPVQQRQQPPQQRQQQGEQDENANNEALLRLLLLLMAADGTQDAPPPTGQVIINDRYILIKEKGAGAFGKVFQARDIQENRVCAIKIIKVKTQQQLDQAMKEIGILRALDHPNVVSCYDAFLSDKNPENPNIRSDSKYLCIVMEYCATDLDRLLTAMAEADLKLPLEVAYSHFLQLLSTLKHIHGHNLIHRDLKPENIFVVCDEEELGRNLQGQLHSLKLKIGDFGVSKVTERNNQLNQTIAGTMTYMAPEVISGEPYTSTCDVYSLGIIFGQVILGLSSEKYAYAVLLIAQGVKEQIGRERVEQLNQVLQEGHATVMLASRSGQIAKFIIENSNEPSTGSLLQRMLSDKEDRPSAAEILEDPLMHAWMDIIEKDRTGAVTPRQESAFHIKNRGRKILACIAGLARIEKTPLVAYTIQMMIELMTNSANSSYSESEIICGKLFLDGGGPAAIVRFIRRITQTQRPEAVAGMWYMCMGLLLTTFGHATLDNDKLKVQRALQAAEIPILIMEMSDPRYKLGVMWSRVYRLISHLSENNISNQFAFSSDSLVKQMLSDAINEDQSRNPLVVTTAGRCLLSLLPALPPTAAQVVMLLAKGSVLAEELQQMQPQQRRTNSAQVVSKLSESIKKYPSDLPVIVQAMYPYLVNTDQVIGNSRRYGQCSSAELDGHAEPNQWYVSCKTCTGTKACLQCAHVCHAEHEVELKFSSTGFSCVCGNSCLCKQSRVVPHMTLSSRVEGPPMSVNGSESITVSGSSISFKQGTNVSTVISTQPIGQLGNQCGNKSVHGKTIAYNEIYIKSGGMVDGIYVGIVVGDKYDSKAYPGVTGNSAAFHCDDGLVLCSYQGKQPMKRQYAGTCGTNSTIGVGVTETGRIFFVRNGQLLPLIPHYILPNDCAGKHVYLLVGLRGKSTIVEVKRDISFSFESKYDCINNDAVSIANQNQVVDALRRAQNTDTVKRTISVLSGEKLFRPPSQLEQPHECVYPVVSQVAQPNTPNTPVAGPNMNVDKDTVLALAQQVEALQKQLALLQRQNQ
jgi:serine/threonine protein kinase